jgi:G3E family GTPase
LIRGGRALTADGRITLNILGGFLGAGKSTWLQHQLRTDALGPVEVLVNEAAEVPVDHLFADGSVRLTVLPDGCCCCAGLPALRAALRAACARADVDGSRPTLWLETSGLAEPSRIVAMLREDPMLGRRITLGEVVLVVDPENLEVQLRESGVVSRQIESATMLVVAKADRASPETLARAQATLRLMNPGAGLALTARGQMHLVTLDDTAAPFDRPDHLAEAEPPVAASLSLQVDSAWSTVSVWLSALIFAERTRILRVKGTISTPAGVLLIQSVRDRIQTPQLLPPDTRHSPALILIGPGLDAAGLQSSLDQWQG